MLTINYSQLTSRFAEHAQKARLGHSIMVLRGGFPFCILAHPTLLTPEETARCERVSATRMHTEISNCCWRIASEQTLFMVTNHGVARCCLVPPVSACVSD